MQQNSNGTRIMLFALEHSHDPIDAMVNLVASLGTLALNYGVSIPDLKALLEQFLQGYAEMQKNKLRKKEKDEKQS